MSDVFLSYAHEDSQRVRQLAADLTRLGWEVWSDDRIRTSAEFDDAIERELDSADCVIVVWSRSSVTSGWVRAEAGAADEQGKLVPVSIEPGVVPPLRFRQLKAAALSTGSLTTPSEAEANMLAEIARLTGKPPEGIDPSLLAGRDADGVSGARRVTAGTWRITNRILGLKRQLDLDLHPSGTATGRYFEFFVWVSINGRWLYDAAEQVLQLELSYPKGMSVERVKITQWIDDHTAVCTFPRTRKARLQRIGG